MSSPHSPQPLQDEHEPDVVQDSHPQTTITEETPNQNYPDHAETLPLHDPDNPVEDEEEGPEGEAEELEQEILEVNSSILSGMSSPSTGLHALVVKPASTLPIYRRGGNKRKKGKGKWKGKPIAKKQQMFDKKIQSLTKTLNPIPFIPHKMLDFPKHEKLLRKLGLWDFVSIDFDKKLRQDLIAQLVATYESRCSYVNGSRIGVNRADLARAFKMHTKREKCNPGVDLDFEPLSEESIGFMEEFVSNWVLLHEDMWMMPKEVMNWLKVIKDGHPEKVDWAGLIWFMVEKELIQGEKLVDCYYASHLQHLMKEQKVFLREEEEELIVEAKEVEVEDFIEEDVKVNVASELEEGPSIKLTLGQDGEKEEKMEDIEMVDFEKCEDSDEDGRGEKQGQWLMQRCTAENNREIGGFEEMKVEEKGLELEEEEEIKEKFHDFPNDDDTLEGDGLTGNFLQAMNGNQIAFSSHVGPSEIRVASPPSFFNQAGKRVIQQDDVFSDRNKRLRINDSWENNNKQTGFGTCMENFQQTMNSIRMFYEQKEQALEQSNMNQQILLDELQKRENVIELLNKERLEEVQKKDGEIYRYERELFLMGNVLEGYRKVVKATQKAFAEYRQKAKLREEPAYVDAGPGGLMLSTGEIEKIRKKQEEEYRMNCLIFELKVREVEERFAGPFDGFLEKVKMLDRRLAGLEGDATELIGLYAKQKIPRVHEPEVSKAPADEVAELTSDEIAEPLADGVAEPPSVGVAEHDKAAKPPSDETAEPQADEIAERPADEVAKTPSVGVAEIPTDV